MRWRRLVAQALRLPTVRAIRGATTVPEDTPTAIRDAVIELLERLRRDNNLSDGEAISAIFTVTYDLASAFPAETARHVGWSQVPLLCTSEIPVPGGMPRCLRVLVHVERDWAGRQPRHVYLRDAVALRPDLRLDPVMGVQLAAAG